MKRFVMSLLLLAGVAFAIDGDFIAVVNVSLRNFRHAQDLFGWIGSTCGPNLYLPDGCNVPSGPNDPNPPASCSVAGSAMIRGGKATITYYRHLEADHPWISSTSISDANLSACIGSAVATYQEPMR